MFEDRFAAEAWVLDVRAAFERGEPAPMPGRRSSTLLVQQATQSATAGGTSIVWLFDDYHHERYVELKVASQGRAAAVRRTFERHILPPLHAMGVRVIEDLRREHVVALSRWWAGERMATSAVWAHESPPTPSGRGGEPGLLKSVAVGPMGLLRKIIGRALMLGHVNVDVSVGIPARDPADHLRRRVKAQNLSLELCAALCASLHPTHQVGLWLMRLLGLRTKEVSDLRVRDVRFESGRTYIDVGTSKTGAGVRSYAVGGMLASLLRSYTDAVHGPEALRDPEARLLPSASGSPTAGIKSISGAIKRAAEQIDLKSYGLHAVPLTTEQVLNHSFRKSIATDLQREAGFPDHVVKKYIGHATGKDVLYDVYTLDLTDDEFDRIAEALEAQLHRRGITNLSIPTPEHTRWWSTSDRYAHRHEIADNLRTTGWLVDGGQPGDPFVGTEEAADRAGVAPRTMRRWFATGRIAATRDGDWRVREDDLAAFLRGETDATPLTLNEIAAAVGCGYHEAYKILTELDPALSTGDNTRLSVTPDHERLLREELARRAALHERAMTIADASRALRISVSALNRTWVPKGLLEVDPETDGHGGRFVTRSSVQRHLSGDGDRDAMTIADAAAVLGVSPQTIRRRMDAGELVRTRIGRRPGVTTASINACAAGGTGRPR